MDCAIKVSRLARSIVRLGMMGKSFGQNSLKAGLISVYKVEDRIDMYIIGHNVYFDAESLYDVQAVVARRDLEDIVRCIFQTPIFRVDIVSTRLDGEGEVVRLS